MTWTSFSMRCTVVLFVVSLGATACAPSAPTPTAAPPAAAKPTTAAPAAASPSPAAASPSPAAASPSPAAASPSPAAATKPGGAAAATPDPVAANEGKALIPQKGCPGCHTIPGIEGANGTVGPNLGGVASRTTIAGGAVPNNGPDDLKAWILDPPAKKPGTQMPKLGLTEDEATKIVAYLETLR